MPISWWEWIIFLLPFSRLLYLSNVAANLSTASFFLFWHIVASFITCVVREKSRVLYNWKKKKNYYYYSGFVSFFVRFCSYFERHVKKRNYKQTLHWSKFILKINSITLFLYKGYGLLSTGPFFSPFPTSSYFKPCISVCAFVGKPIPSWFLFLVTLFPMLNRRPKKEKKKESKVLCNNEWLQILVHKASPCIKLHCQKL